MKRSASQVATSTSRGIPGSPSKHEVVQFDSPEKRDQREKMFKYDAEIREQLQSNPHLTIPDAVKPKKKTEKDVLNTITKLYKSEQKKDYQLVKLRHEKESKELKEIREVPQINKNYQFKTYEHVPIHLRKNEDQFEDIIRLQRQKKEKELKEIQNECTFTPTIPKSSKLADDEGEASRRKDPMDTVNKLLKWKEEKELNNLKKVSSNVFGDSETTFKPAIGIRSQKLALGRRRSMDLPIHERLLELKDKRDEDIMARQEEEVKNYFSPKINKNSIKILQNKNSEGIITRSQKLKFQETDMVDYYKTEDVRTSHKDYITENKVHAKDAKKASKKLEKPHLKKNHMYDNIKSKYKGDQSSNGQKKKQRRNVQFEIADNRKARKSSSHKHISKSPARSKSQSQRSPSTGKFPSGDGNGMKGKQIYHSEDYIEVPPLVGILKTSNSKIPRKEATSPKTPTQNKKERSASGRSKSQSRSRSDNSKKRVKVKSRDKVEKQAPASKKKQTPYKKPLSRSSSVAKNSGSRQNLRSNRHAVPEYDEEIEIVVKDDSRSSSPRGARLSVQESAKVKSYLDKQVENIVKRNGEEKTAYGPVWESAKEKASKQNTAKKSQKSQQSPLKVDLKKSSEQKKDHPKVIKGYTASSSASQVKEASALKQSQSSKPLNEIHLSSVPSQMFESQVVSNIKEFDKSAGSSGRKPNQQASPARNSQASPKKISNEFMKVDLGDDDEDAEMEKKAPESATTVAPNKHSDQSISDMMIRRRNKDQLKEVFTSLYFE